MRDSKEAFTFAPRKTGKVHWQTGRRIRGNEIEKISKKNFKFFLQETKRSFSFAPALRDKRKTKRRHVRRHIELTAVLTEMLKQKE